MNNRDSEKWIWPPADQWLTWSLPLFAVFSVVASQVMFFFMRLKGLAWIRCYTLVITLAIAGIALILWAKLPLYREHRFFTFGSRALPEARRMHYRWGYICAWLSVAMLAGLFLSRP